MKIILISFLFVCSDGSHNGLTKYEYIKTEQISKKGLKNIIYTVQTL